MELAAVCLMGMSRTRRQSSACLGVSVSDVGEESVDGNQPGVPGGRAVPSFRFQVVEEGQDGVRTEICQPQSDHLAAAAPCREAEEEFDAVSVGKDGVGADIALRREVVLEEAAEQGRKEGLFVHDRPPGTGRRSWTNAWKRVFASSRRAVVIRR